MGGNSTSSKEFDWFRPHLIIKTGWSCLFADDGHDSAKYAGSLLGGTTSQQFHFADFTLDQSRYRLQQGQRILRLEKRPMELLILLIERRGDLVSREEIGQRLWGKDVFLDVDRSINTAVSKVRVALRDDPDKPRFVETVVGKDTVSPRRWCAAMGMRSHKRELCQRRFSQFQELLFH